MTIAIDMDNVIADIETHFINWYAKRFGEVVPRERLQGVAEIDAFPEKEAVRKFLDEPGFFRSAPLIPGAQSAVHGLMKNFDVYIVSAAMEFPVSLHEKYLWLQEHFPFVSWRKIIFCGDKSKIATDIMVDDHLKNLNYFKGKGILFTAAHNVNVDYPVRVNGWREATSLLNSLL